jgi:hypothetical protein
MRTNADQLLRVLLPTGPGPAGSYLNELSAERLEPQFACRATRPFRLSFDGTGTTLADIPAAVYSVKKGTTLTTIQPGKTHRQTIAEDCIVVEVALPSNLAPMAGKLAGRPVACRLSFGGDVGSGWKTCTTSGRYFGAETFRTSPERIDAITLGTAGGEEAHISVI